ncbi:hypothetical protein KFK09_004370 [Dendrobium nobile]|uniref:Uncharacterized protein n=1 Tax=Dendrobium nobile TaxID=94219 RepID=A0A8T3C3W0_DENNO|nr:hypothetical protein KFK09_004370 [Dendrobium nobile]
MTNEKITHSTKQEETKSNKTRIFINYRAKLHLPKRPRIKKILMKLKESSEISPQKPNFTNAKQKPDTGSENVKRQEQEEGREKTNYEGKQTNRS